ncbi:MAG: homogentisate 1,2-dioxygenase [Elusimicrobia bacterium]|nr:homogentisate 1,2-dioxygenase [Elusimicrobiota bacterium]
MALIVRRGAVPKVPHTEFYAKPGVLALEEIHGSYGFSGAYSRKMHVRRYPTEQVQAPAPGGSNLRCEPPKNVPLQPFHLRTSRLGGRGDFLRSRIPLVFGRTTVVSVARPDKSTPQGEFFRNGEFHELLFVQEGEGALCSEYGELAFKPLDYLVVPKGTTWQLKLDAKKGYFLIVESAYPIQFAPHHINPAGQATLMAPVVETEIGLPVLGEARDETGRYSVFVKHDGGRLTRLSLGHHPFDLAGWEGSLYPFSFASSAHHSIAREIHTAPPVRQTFQAGQAPFSGFSVCTFRAQVEGWHPLDIPAPYAHYNVDSDEVMFFSNTSYGARKGVIEPGSLTFHPGALPHSPQGDAAARSKAARGKVSDYLAVMLDTFFEPLQITKAGLSCADKDYPLSWHKAAAGAGLSPAA